MNTLYFINATRSNDQIEPFPSCVLPSAMSSISDSNPGPAQVFFFESSRLPEGFVERFAAGDSCAFESRYKSFNGMAIHRCPLLCPLFFSHYPHRFDPYSFGRKISDFQLSSPPDSRLHLFNGNANIDFRSWFPDTVGNPELRCDRDGDDAILKALPVPDLKEVNKEITKPFHCWGAYRRGPTSSRRLRVGAIPCARWTQAGARTSRGTGAAPTGQRPQWTRAAHPASLEQPRGLS